MDKTTIFPLLLSVAGRFRILYPFTNNKDASWEAKLLFSSLKYK